MKYFITLITLSAILLTVTFCKKEETVKPIGNIMIDSITIDGIKVYDNGQINHIGFKPNIKVYFDKPVDTVKIDTYNIYFSGDTYNNYTHQFNTDSKVLSIIPNENLKPLTLYRFTVSQGKNLGGNIINGYSAKFFTKLDSTDKFEQISDDSLLTLIQHRTFKYFWDFAHPTSGLARERNTSGDIVTIGGSGFGIMAIIIGIERGFITRAEGINRFTTIVSFLKNADRFHGAWGHWYNGVTGKVYPFSTNDNGGDLVETAFLVQGLITLRQYLNPNDSAENNLINQINELVNGVEWTWYTKGGEDVLYWHWSPTVGWAINMQIRGYNEALIVYVLAASSTTYPINASVYHSGWARNGAITNGKTFYGITLPVGFDYGGPLFFAHYSFLGLDPRNLSDNYANYWQQNVNHTLINRQHCIINPGRYPLYSADCWGLTASDDNTGYGVHEPTRDIGVISPTAALSSMPYTPEESKQVARFLYYKLGNKVWGEYGFYDAFNVNANWWGTSYLAIDQGPIAVMIENYRSGLCWNLFMSAPEVKQGLSRLGFTTNK